MGNSANAERLVDRLGVPAEGIPKLYAFVTNFTRGDLKRAQDVDDVIGGGLKEENLGLHAKHKLQSRWNHLPYVVVKKYQDIWSSWKVGWVAQESFTEITYCLLGRRLGSPNRTTHRLP